jgi:hypothetical protein
VFPGFVAKVSLEHAHRALRGLDHGDQLFDQKRVIVEAHHHAGELAVHLGPAHASELGEPASERVCERFVLGQAQRAQLDVRAIAAEVRAAHALRVKLVHGAQRLFEAHFVLLHSRRG